MLSIWSSPKICRLVHVYSYLTSTKSVTLTFSLQEALKAKKKVSTFMMTEMVIGPAKLHINWSDTDNQQLKNTEKENNFIILTFGYTVQTVMTHMKKPFENIVGKQENWEIIPQPELDTSKWHLQKF